MFCHYIFFSASSNTCILIAFACLSTQKDSYLKWCFCVESDVDGCSHRHLRCMTDKLHVLLLRLVVCEFSDACNNDDNNHRLRGSASPASTATGFVNGKWQFSTLTDSTALDRSPKYLSQVITSATPTAVPN